MKINRELPKMILVCMKVDTDNVDAEGNESIWYGGKVSQRGVEEKGLGWRKGLIWPIFAKRLM